MVAASPVAGSSTADAWVNLLLTEGERDLAARLAEPFDAAWADVPALVRVVEDMVIWRLYRSRTSAGDSGHAALHYAARKTGVPFETLRHRVRKIEQSCRSNGKG